MRIAERPEDIHAIRVAAASAELVLGGDIVVAGSKKVLAAAKPGLTQMVVNLAEFLPGDFTRNADFSLPTERLKRAHRCSGRERTARISSMRRGLVTALFGSATASNIFLVGYAYQLGAPAALGRCDRAGDRAQRRGGRDEPGGVPLGTARRRRPRRRSRRCAQPRARTSRHSSSQSLDEIVERRVAFLTDYQNAAYAARYRALVDQVRAAEAAQAPGAAGLPKRSRATCSS